MDRKNNRIAKWLFYIYSPKLDEFRTLDWVSIRRNLEEVGVLV